MKFPFDYNKKTEIFDSFFSNSIIPTANLETSNLKRA